MKPKLKFVSAGRKELQIDIDFPDARTQQHHKAHASLVKMGVIEEAFIAKPSRSNKGIHITVKLTSPLTIMERIALAAALGDDPVRVVLNWSRARARDPHPILFLEKNSK